MIALIDSPLINDTAGHIQHFLSFSSQILDYLLTYQIGKLESAYIFHSIDHINRRFFEFHMSSEQPIGYSIFDFPFRRTLLTLLAFHRDLPFIKKIMIQTLIGKQVLWFIYSVR
jgi:hypothetical protein